MKPKTEIKPDRKATFTRLTDKQREALRSRYPYMTLSQAIAFIIDRSLAQKQQPAE